mmetsp:Transcript_4593/g.7112  ORF Transcript_4593/g.7112 Transcript_4593/m.7112 type:complete len:99 (+) Transcript_4593:108-404(+)
MAVIEDADLDEEENEGFLATLQNQCADLLEQAQESFVVRKGKRVVENVTRASVKILFSTGHAAWVVGTSVLLMGLPLMLAIEEEFAVQQMQEQQSRAS